MEAAQGLLEARNPLPPRARARGSGPRVRVPPSLSRAPSATQPLDRTDRGPNRGLHGREAAARGRGWVACDRLYRRDRMTPPPPPEGPGSVSGAPAPPSGFADPFTSRYIDT